MRYFSRLVERGPAAIVFCGPVARRRNEKKATRLFGDTTLWTQSNVFDSDIWWSFKRSPVTVVTAILAAICILAVSAPVLAPHNPYDLAQISLLDSNLPPAWNANGNPSFKLGTDQQGATSCPPSCTAAAFHCWWRSARWPCRSFSASVLACLPVCRGRVDSVIMRIADIQLTFPAILVALLISASGGSLCRARCRDALALYVIIFSIGLTGWPQYARTVRGATLVEKQGIRAGGGVIGVSNTAIMFRHVLPNVLGPVLVIATLNIAERDHRRGDAFFLGVGMPPTQPSLGTLISEGQNFLFSGEWWITVFPGSH